MECFRTFSLPLQDSLLAASSVPWTTPGQSSPAFGARILRNGRAKEDCFSVHLDLNPRGAKAVAHAGGTAIDDTVAADDTLADSDAIGAWGDDDTLSWFGE